MESIEGNIIDEEKSDEANISGSFGISFAEKDLPQPRVEAYADALWVMLERLETLERTAYEKSDLVYQMHNKSK